MMETTATFRDYAFENLGGGTFSINTSLASCAIIKVAANHPEFAIAAEFDRNTARQLGTDLLRWTGSPLTCTLERVLYDTANGVPFLVDVTDGEVGISVTPLDKPNEWYNPSDEEVIDIAQRLIVWAGIAVTADV